MQKVSILLASYNRLELLKGSIESALSQDYTNSEIVIIDDGSDDETLEWLQYINLRNPEIKIYYQENKGPGSARAEGVRKCQGDIVCILDSDDILLPGAISLIMNEFNKDQYCDLIYTNNVQQIYGKEGGKVTRYPRFANNNEMINSILLRPIVPFKHSGIAFRKKTAVDIGNYDENFQRKIDIEFFLRFLFFGKKVKLIEYPPVVLFRIHKRNISRDRVIGLKYWWKIIDKYNHDIYIPKFLLKFYRLLLEVGKAIVEKMR